MKHPRASSGALDIVLHIDTEGVSAFSIGLAYEPDRLSMIGFTECAGFSIPGACVTSGLQVLAPFAVGVTFDNVGPVATAYAWDGLDSSAPYENVPQTLVVGTAVFQNHVALGGTVVTTSYRPSVDGIADASNDVGMPAASAFVVVPEPATVGLLALGLLTLAVTRR